MFIFMSLILKWLDNSRIHIHISSHNEINCKEKLKKKEHTHTHIKRHDVVDDDDAVLIFCIHICKKQEKS